MEQLYRYDLISASLAGEPRHPQQVVRDLGLKIVYGEPVPIADCWLFRFAEPFDAVLPPFIEPVRRSRPERGEDSQALLDDPDGQQNKDDPDNNVTNRFHKASV